MDVQDLRPGDHLWLCYTGYDNGPVTDQHLVKFAGWDDHGINIIHRGGGDDYVKWVEVGRYLAHPSTDGAVSRPGDERLPTTIPEPE
jgi:hypothetical protein